MRSNNRILNYVIKQQLAHKEDISIVMVAGLNPQFPRRGISFKVPRSVGLSMEAWEEKTAQKAMVVVLQGTTYVLRPAIKINNSPSEAELGYAMHWIHTVIKEPAFAEYAKRECPQGEF